jgi:hypothetical protein
MVFDRVPCGANVVVTFL